MHDGVRQLRKFLKEGLADRHSVTLEQRRAGLDRLGAMLDPLPEDVSADHVQLGDVSAIRYRTPVSKPDRQILYLHGGAFVAGSARSHAMIAARLARQAQAEVSAVDYRLAPEHPFPAASDDCLCAYRYCLEEKGSKAIALVGDSAGGSLVLETLIEAREAGLEQPLAAVLLSPVTDLTQSGSSYDLCAEHDPFMDRALFAKDIAHYLHGADPASPKTSPVFADLSGLAPLLIHVGGAEILLSDSTMLAEKVGIAGGSVQLEIWPDMVHVWHAFPNWLPEAVQALDGIAEFLDRYWP